MLVPQPADSSGRALESLALAMSQTSPIGRTQMKSSSTDQIQGELHELKGKVKEVAGQVTNNPDLETKGKGENLAGKVQKKVGQIERILEK